MFKYALEGQLSERLSYRSVQESDFDTWLKFCEDKDSLKYIFSQSDQLFEADEKCRKWFDRVFQRYENSLGGMNALRTKDSETFVGQCGLLVQTVDDIQELEVGYSLMPEHRGKGYASEASQKCRDYAFENSWSDSLISIISPENRASINVALRNGMSFEKQTVFHDTPVNIYRIYKSEWERNKML